MRNVSFTFKRNGENLHPKIQKHRDLTYKINYKYFTVVCMASLVLKIPRPTWSPADPCGGGDGGGVAAAAVGGVPGWPGTMNEGTLKTPIP